MTKGVRLSQPELDSLNKKGRATTWIDGELVLLMAPGNDGLHK